MPHGRILDVRQTLSALVQLHAELGGKLNDNRKHTEWIAADMASVERDISYSTPPIECTAAASCRSFERIALERLNFILGMFAPPPRPARDRENSRSPQGRFIGRSDFLFPAPSRQHRQRNSRSALSCPKPDATWFFGRFDRLHPRLERSPRASQIEAGKAVVVHPPRSHRL